MIDANASVRDTASMAVWASTDEGSIAGVAIDPPRMVMP
jgi:hypothetical protein